MTLPMSAHKVPASDPMPKAEPKNPAPSPKVETLEFDGTLVANELDQFVIGTVAGQSTKFLVREGDRVKKGQVLATVDIAARRDLGSTTFNAQSEAAHAEQLSDQLGAALNNHQALFDKATAAYAQAEKEHRENLQRAQDELDKTLQGAPPGELGRAQDALENAKEKRDKAKALSDKNQHAYEEGWVSRNQATASKIAYEVAEAGVTKAEARLADLNKGAGEAEARAARAAFSRVKDAEDNKLKTAREALEAVQNGGLAFGGGSPISMPSSVIRFDPSLKGRIAGRATIKAPFDGKVVKSAVPTQPNTLIVLKDGSLSHFRAQVTAPLVKRLRPGMVVRLSPMDSGTLVAIGQADKLTGLSPVRVSTSSQSTPGAKAHASILFRASDPGLKAVHN